MSDEFKPRVRRPGKTRFIGGLPDPDDPKRCIGTIRHGLNAGERCKHYAAQGSNRCRFHGGHLRKSKRPSNLYTRGASQKLQELLTQFQEDADERVSLSSEIDAARLLAERAMRAFDETHFGEKAGSYRDELKVAARAQLRESLSHVASLIEKHAKVMALSEGTFSPEQVAQITNKMARILEKYLIPQHQELFDAIKAELDELTVTRPTVSITIGGS